MHTQDKKISQLYGDAMFSDIFCNVWMSSHQMTDVISNARLITSSQTPTVTVTLITPSYSQMNQDTKISIPII